MLRLFKDAHYDFIGIRRWAYGFSALFIIPGLLWLLVAGLNYSIEFTGGTFIHIRTTTPIGTGAIRAALTNGGVTGAEVNTFGSETEYSVKARVSAERAGTEAGTEETVSAVQRALDAGLGNGTYTIVRREAVGPKVGRELQGKALIAILFSFVVTLMYLAVRFEWRFGLAAIAATAHDILATIIFIRYLNLEVSLVVVAAVLTIVGYSLNDTIVIFDRVRENLRKYRRQNLYEILNLSINETLPRTVLTGGTTILTALTLAFIAGEVIRPFSLVMTFGIIVGTFSSIFVASPVLLWIERRWPGEDARGVRTIGTRAPASQVAPATPTPSPSPRTPLPAR
ncbi:MAG TPA: protein translocase subunit SecF [Gemmatimonadales bacterium]|nr:protein translocase subunit SecF [Gemmatimonadales bacterium]